MNLIKSFLFIVFGLLIFSSCEDVIVLDLEEADTRLVIEGTIDADAAEAAVRLTLTNSFYDPSANEVVDGALVRLIGPLGDVYPLAQAAGGTYRVADLPITSGEKYTLEVTADDILYTAVAEVPYPVALDSLSQEKINFPFGNQEEE